MAAAAEAQQVPTEATAAAEACSHAASPTPSSVFARPSPSVLCMQGAFEIDTQQQVRQIVDPAAIKSLVIDSGGGFSESAIELAKLAEQYRWLIIVKNKCLSSCANYVFLSRTEKVVLPQSVVGWHGLPPDPSTFDPAEFEKVKARPDVPPGLKSIDNETALTLLIHSKEFLAERGIPPALCQSLPQAGHSEAYVGRLQTLNNSDAHPFWSYGKEALEKKFGVQGILYMWEPQTPEEGTELAFKQHNANLFFFDLTPR